QPEASSPGAKDENTGAGLCRSRLVVQERLGHYKKAAADKKLAGAAKNSFVQKCLKTDGAADKATQCEKAAADKKLAGAAKNSFIQKCVKTA
ncbi:hypothetical protein ACSZN5_18030, partial [Aeromonas caviae]